MIALVVWGALGWLTVTARAADRTWTGAVNGYWSEPGNWEPAGTPQDGDTLYFDGIDTNRFMTNDLTALAPTGLDFAGTNRNAVYQLGGNSLTLGTLEATPDGSGSVTINCPLVFPSGGEILANPVAGPVIRNVESIALKGSITVETGTLALVGDGTSLNATAEGNLSLWRPISGAGDVLVETTGDFGNPGIVEFDGTQDNTFSGTLYLNTGLSGRIVFNQPTGHVVNSRLEVTNTANVWVAQTNQIGGNTTVVIQSGGQLSLDGTNVTVGNLVMRNLAGDTASATLDTGRMQVALNSGITVRCDNTNFPPTIKGWLNLNHPATLDVHGTVGVGLQIAAGIAGQGFTKIGNSTLVLSGNNRFTGNVEVDAGVLDLDSISPWGFSPAALVTLDGGSLTLGASAAGRTLIVNGQTIAGDMPGSLLTVDGPPTIAWSGPIILNTNLVLLGGDLIFDGPISGPGGLGFFNLNLAEIAGITANSYTGTTLVRCPMLIFDKPVGTNAFAGPLVVGGGSAPDCQAIWYHDYQNSHVALTLYGNGTVDLSASKENFSQVTFNGGSIKTGTGQCAVYGPVTVNPASTSAAIYGNLVLPSGNPSVFVVGDGAADPDLWIGAVMSGGATQFVKQGPGTMTLDNANTFTGTTLVEEGVLDVWQGLALSTPGAVVFDGATLRLTGNNGDVLYNNLEVVGSGAGGTNGVIEVASNGFWILGGNILLDAASSINVRAEGYLELPAVVSGTGPLTKDGPGTLEMHGPASNSYTGDTIVSEGPLTLAKDQFVTAVPGNLVLGPAPASAPATAVFLQTGELGGTVATVNGNSVLNLNGQNLTLSELHLNDGGRVVTGSGVLSLTSGATVTVGSLGLFGSHVGASIQGYLGLTPNSLSPDFSVRSYSPFAPFAFQPELDVAATIFIDGYQNPNLVPTGIKKDGTGVMRLDGNNTYQGLTAINAGTLEVDGSQPASLVAVNGGTLKGTGDVGRVYLTTASAVVAPGDSPGILTSGNFDHGGGSGTLQVELNGTTPGSGYDQLEVQGSVDLTGLNLKGTLKFAAATHNQFIIIANDGTDPVVGTFNGLAQGATVNIGNEAFQVSYTGGDGNDVVLTDLGQAFRPRLSIERAAADSVRLLWGTNDPAFTLQSVTNLGQTNWSAVSPAPIVNGSVNVVTNPVDQGQKFYRLFKP